MIVLCYAAKAGCGTTTLVASLGVGGLGPPTLLVDLAGDLALALGVAADDRPGVIDWLESDAAPRQLDELVLRVDDSLEIVVARGPDTIQPSTSPAASPTDRRTPEVDARRWAALASWLLDRCAVDGGRVAIDAGTTVVGAGLVDACAARLLVTTRCYLALRRRSPLPLPPTGVIVVSEPGRSLRISDVEHTVGTPVIADLPRDTGVARAVDSGLLCTRPPRGWSRRVQQLWDVVDERPGTLHAA